MAKLRGRDELFNGTGIDMPNEGHPYGDDGALAPDYGPPMLIPELGPPTAGRGSLSPRENFSEAPQGGGGTSTKRPALGGMEGGSMAAPKRPSSPESMAGSTFEAPSPGPGVLPFNNGGAMGGANLAMSRLFGKRGGLQGGGLGVPLDPVADEQSDPIALLMKLLGQGGGV
jgi:hypothetical protein